MTDDRANDPTNNRYRCPNCEANLYKYRELLDSGDLPYCFQCQFPLILVAGKYRIEKLLAEGGYGSVYLANHIDFDDEDAKRVIKIIKPEIFKQPGMAKRFRREVKLTHKLSQRNDHIVRVYDDFGHIPEISYYFVMEYLQGAPLSDRMLEYHQIGQLFPLDVCFHIVKQLCDAIHYTHGHGVLHRDLKPQNLVLIDHKEDPNFLKVLDFGIAKPLDDYASQETGITQGILGTPEYISPEQCQGMAIDGRADIYSIGIIFYELLTGRSPFLPPEDEEFNPQTLTTILLAQINQAPEPPSQLQPERITAELDAVILKVLAKKPDDRYQSAKEFWEAIEPLVPAALSMNSQSPGSAAPSPSHPGTTPTSTVALDRKAAQVLWNEVGSELQHAPQANQGQTPAFSVAPAPIQRNTPPASVSPHGEASLPPGTRIVPVDEGRIEVWRSQLKDWASDPMLVMRTQQKLQQCIHYTSSSLFKDIYSEEQVKLILEVAFPPPNKLKKFLQENNIELRNHQAQSHTPPPHMFSPDITAPIKSALEQSSKQQMHTPPPMNPAGRPPQQMNPRGQNSSSSPYSATPQQQSSSPFGSAPPQQASPYAAQTPQGNNRSSQSPNYAPHSRPTTPPGLTNPSQQPRQEATTSSQWDDPIGYQSNDDLLAAGPTISSPPTTFWLLIVLLAFSLLGVFYGFLEMSSTPAIPDTPVSRSITAISSTRLPELSYTTLQARPARPTFVFIPIQSKTRADEIEYHVLFSTQENRRLLIFAPYNESGIVSHLKRIPKPGNPGETIVQPVWRKDLNVGRTYTGALEKLQRREGGPLEFMLAGEYVDVNKIPGLPGISFPMDSMLLTVGKKPEPPASIGGFILILSLLFSSFFGGLLYFIGKPKSNPF